MLRWIVLVGALAGLGCAAFGTDGEETAFEPQDTVYEPCTPYCQRMMANCHPGTTAVFPSGDDCYAACIEWPRDGEEGDETGGTLQCHETFAEQTPVDHQEFCPRAGPLSEDCV